MTDCKRRNLDVLAAPDFNARCRQVTVRIQSDDLKTPEEVAAALGLDWEFFASCMAVHLAAMTGVPAYVVTDKANMN